MKVITEKEARNSSGVFISPLLSMLGANKENRVFASAEDVDKFISKLRDEWLKTRVVAVHEDKINLKERLNG